MVSHCRAAVRSRRVSSLHEQNDARLLSDRAQPDESFAIFYRRHAEAIVRFAASRGLGADEAADVVSDTFTKSLQMRAFDERAREDSDL
jgi:DNA-directed RNA polymerase specialized sigma24 family protein